MPLHFFAIPTLDPQPAQDELNRFCGAERMVAVDRQFVAAGLDSYWALRLSTARQAVSKPSDELPRRKRRGISKEFLPIAASCGEFDPKRLKVVVALAGD